MKFRVSPTKTPYRGNKKAYVQLEEARVLKLLKAAHIKIGWVFCRVGRKKELNRCYRCLGHMAADCRGPDRSRCCWRCGEEVHTAGSCTRQRRCYLCRNIYYLIFNQHFSTNCPFLNALFIQNRNISEDIRK